MNRILLPLACAGLAALAMPVLASRYEKPYALFVPAPRSATMDTVPAAVMRVDGQLVNASRTEPVAPGVREVEVAVPGARSMSKPVRQTLVVMAEPCKRYYLAAKRSSHTAHDWQAYVDSTEVIGECARRVAA